jgi:DNA anti-recombination protein RmuC
MTPPNDQSGATATQTAEKVGNAAAPGVEAAGAASLDKVRDILFGNHMRDVDRRFTRLEERVAKEMRDLKDALRDRLDAFEAYVKQEHESLATQARSEQAERSSADARLAREAADAAQVFERRTAAIDEQLSKNQREMRQSLLEQHQRLSEDFRQKIDEVLAALAREAHELRTDKTDRQALASLLKEMAMRLTDEFNIPGAAEGGNG